MADDVDVLLAFYDYPAEHWVHPWTTNPIESTFATVNRPPTPAGDQRTKIQGAGIAMAFKLIESAQGGWRAVNEPHHDPVVRAGATFKNGKLVEHDTETDREEET